MGLKYEELISGGGHTWDKHVPVIWLAVHPKKEKKKEERKKGKRKEKNKNTFIVRCDGSCL